MFCQLNSRMKASQILLEAKYMGKCTNIFDEDGEGLFPELYRDVSDFAVHEEDAKQITAEDFYKQVTSIEPELEDEIGPNRIYLHDVDNDIYMIYDDDTDIHYFFIT